MNKVLPRFFLPIIASTILFGITYAIPPQASAGVCNVFAGGSCQSSCDPRTQTSSTDACFGAGTCCYTKSSYPSSCTYSGNDCQCTNEVSTIASTCTDGKPNSFNCGGQGAICVYSGYVTCEQATSDTNGNCAEAGHTCQYGWTYTYSNTAANQDCSRWGNAVCCEQLQPCNHGPLSISSCNASNVPPNTCGKYSGNQTSADTTYVHSGCTDSSTPDYTCTPSTTCIQTNTTTSSCTTGFIDNCSKGAGYTCTNSSVCTTSIFVNVYTDYNHTQTNNGGALNGINISDGGGNTIPTGSNGWPAGQVQFTGKATGNYTIGMTTPTNYYAVNGNSHIVSLTNNSGNVTTTFYVSPLYSISGNVFYDANHNLKDDTGDSSYGSGTITISGGPTSVSPIGVAGNGTWTTPTTLESGTYTISYSASSLPSGYSMTTPSSWTVTVGNPAGSPACSTGSSLDAACGGTNNGSISSLNFGIDEPYQISGRVFNDVNLDTHYDSPDTAFTQSPSIHITGGSINMTVTASAADGTYSTGQILPPGSYTVSYITTLPTGYTFQTSSSFLVTVGFNPACSGGGSPDATCGAPNTNSINNLNFGVTNENSHIQTTCLDLRMDNNGGSTVDNFFPAPGATCGGVNASEGSITNGDCSTGAGIAYSCNGTIDFGLGSANANNQVAGGSTYPECYTPPSINNIKTSYEFLMATAQSSNITPTDMNNISVCGAGGIADCVLPLDDSGNPDLPKGIYHADGNVVLDMSNFANQTYTLPAPTDPYTQYQSYVFLINGNLTITGGNFLISKGSAAIFSTSGNITVTKDIGQAVTDPNSPSVNTPNLEGIYSADNSFIIQSYGLGTSVCNADGTPLDKKLNILGVVIDNAAQTGGSLVDNRNLCEYDNQCPALCTGDCGGTTGNSVTEQLLTIMADGQFLLQNNYIWQEQKP